MWNSECFTMQETFRGNGYLSVKGVWGDSASVCYIFNIYSPCNTVGKRALWEEILSLRSSCFDSAWRLAEDFNIVRCASERKGVTSYFPTREMTVFDDFIDDMRLNDLPLIGRKFTSH